MDKAPSAFRTISEVSNELDVPKHVLRFWESKFTQIKPMKLGGGRRYYRPEDLDLLRGIRGLLYDQGYTIKGVQKILRENGVRFVKDHSRKPESAPLKARKGPVIPDVAADAAAGRVKRNGGGAAKPQIGKAGPGRPAAVDHKAALIGALADLEACRKALRSVIAGVENQGKGRAAPQA